MSNETIFHVECVNDQKRFNTIEGFLEHVNRFHPEIFKAILDYLVEQGYVTLEMLEKM